jgi:hypothetical protein
VKRGLNSSRALSVREMASDPKVKDELVNHILYLEECVFGPTISDMRRHAFQIAEESFKLFSLCSQRLRGPQPQLNKGPPGPGSDLQNSSKTRKTLKMSMLPAPEGVL